MTSFSKNKGDIRKIYLDYAASAPISERAIKAMEPFFRDRFGNASSLHSFGREALSAVDGARDALASALGADFREIIFTGSATEANNLAIRGVVKKWNSLNAGHARRENRGLPKVVITATEHETVLETARDLEREGRAELVYLLPDKSGVVRADKLSSALDGKTALVSVMFVNNVTGAVQPIFEMAKILAEFKEKKPVSAEANFAGESLFPVFHTDAVQAFQYFDCDHKKLGADMISLSSHKIYGPKGAGALFVSGGREGGFLDPVITGGGQEFGLRSGTPNTPALAGFGEAVREAMEKRGAEKERVAKLKKFFIELLKDTLPGIILNGTEDKAKSAPHILNMSFADIGVQELITRFDLAGVAVSSGAACSARSAKASYVLTAMGLPDEIAGRSIRFSFGKETNVGDLKEAAGRIKKAIAASRP